MKQTGKFIVNRRSSGGFTLVELVIVIVITGILSMSASTVISHITNIRVNGVINSVVADLRYMQTLAMSTHDRTWLVFDTDNNSYTGYIEDSENPGRANRTIAAKPISGKVFTVSFDSGFLTGVGLTSVDFNGNPEVAFDPLGAPYGQFETALSSQGSITFSDGSTVIVTQETGYSCLDL